jgi:hypothetical protein
MLQRDIWGPPSPDNQNLERNRLARIRRQAKKRGFRVLKDWSGTYSLVDIKVWPPLSLVGATHVPLAVIDMVVGVPLPLPPPRPPPRKKRVARLDGNSLSQSQASHPAAASFTSLIDLLNGGGTR